METIDTATIHRCFSRALKTYDAHAHAQHRINLHLAGLLPAYADRHYDRLLEIGCGSGRFTQALQSQCTAYEWVLNDLCDDCQERVRPLFSGLPPVFCIGNAEEEAFPGTFNLIASASAFQWMKDLPRLFRKLAAALSPGGVLLFNTFTPDNLHEIKTLTGCGLTYPSPTQLREWLSVDFHILHEETEILPLTFTHPLDVLKHLKYTGVTATASGPWTRGRQEDFCLRYRQQFSTPSKEVTLTYSPLYMLALKK